MRCERVVRSALTENGSKSATSLVAPRSTSRIRNACAPSPVPMASVVNLSKRCGAPMPSHSRPAQLPGDCAASLRGPKSRRPTSPRSAESKISSAFFTPWPLQPVPHAPHERAHLAENRRDSRLRALPLLPRLEGVGRAALRGRGSPSRGRPSAMSPALEASASASTECQSSCAAVSSGVVLRRQGYFDQPGVRASEGRATSCLAGEAAPDAHKLRPLVEQPLHDIDLDVGIHAFGEAVDLVFDLVDARPRTRA